MTAPSIREALCEARPYVAELATFSPHGERHRELLERIDAALSAPPPDEAAIRADERERCAKVAEGWLESSWVDEVFAARSIAAAIRAGGAK